MPLHLPSLRSSSANNWRRSIVRSDKGVGALSALLACWRKHWIALDALRASASVVGPGMGVLKDSDPSDGMAITACVKCHIWEAGRSRRHRAAVRDLGDPAGIIELPVPLLVEGGIAHWRWRRLATDAGRHLVVDVKVLSATLFLGTSLTSATMLCEDFSPVVVALEFTISKEVFAHFSPLGMTIDHDNILHAHDRRPFTVMVDLEADGVAVLVIFLTGLIDASLRATLGEELLLCVIMEEDVNIAFNLLGRRPIDLAVLLQALLFEDEFLVPGPASSTALLVFDIASNLLATVLLAHALLKPLLD
jgi:hypothetical protein